MVWTKNAFKTERILTRILSSNFLLLLLIVVVSDFALTVVLPHYAQDWYLNAIANNDELFCTKTINYVLDDHQPHLLLLIIGVGCSIICMRPGGILAQIVDDLAPHGSVQQIRQLQSPIRSLGQSYRRKNRRSKPWLLAQCVGLRSDNGESLLVSEHTEAHCLLHLTARVLLERLALV